LTSWEKAVFPRRISVPQTGKDFVFEMKAIEWLRHGIQREK
jgi:hypothetical protein